MRLDSVKNSVLEICARRVVGGIRQPRLKDHVDGVVLGIDAALPAHVKNVIDGVILLEGESVVAIRAHSSKMLYSNADDQNQGEDGFHF